MTPEIIPPEIWALAGVVLGTLIPAVFGFLNGRMQAKHESNKTLIEALERRTADLESHLREEAGARRSLEAEVRTREKEAHATADKARWVMSIAMSHINRLNGHIESDSPPPPPPLPTEVEAWVQQELWTARLGQAQADTPPPAT